MNILSVMAEELDAGGAFQPAQRVQNHLCETLKTEDRDLVKVGLISGQKGVGQAHVVETKCDKKGRKQITYKIQLLPLCFDTVEKAIAFSNEMSPPAERGAALPPVTAEVANGEEIRDSRQKACTATGEARPDRYAFEALDAEELAHWKTHPYTPGPGERESGAIVRYGKSVPSKTVVQRFSQPRIDIFMALPRPKLVDKVLQYLASMSIGRVHFFASSRSDTAYFSSPRIRTQPMADNIRIGLEQGMRTTAPPVILSGSLKSALSLALPLFKEASEGSIMTLIAHPYAVGVDGQGRATDKSDSRASEVFAPVHMLKTQLETHKGSVILTLGPEGGFTDDEICTLMQALPNPRLVSLGNDIMRCEVALLSLIGQTQMLLSAEGNDGVREYDARLNEATVYITPPGRKRPRVAADGRACSEPLSEDDCMA